MSRRLAGVALIASLIAAVLATVRADEAAAALSFAQCEGAPGFGCAALAVPLDRSGALAGTVTLRVERRVTGSAPAQSAVMALAGGPGQAALPLAPFVAKAMASALQARDLLVFDQRGTGNSDPLSCAALSESARGPVGQLLERCALQIGPSRGDYTTQESVADIESLRRAAGYRKLVLYGTSYGTKVALEYAARYPAQVEALVLDSVVPGSGLEPLGIPSFNAMPAVLRELCSNGVCAGITANPLSDMARLASRLRRRSLRGDAFDGRGHRSSARVRESDLLEILQAGDLNPALRALLPASVHSALHGDPDPLVRLRLLSLGLIPSVPNVPVENSPSIDEALFASTSCEETPFPWQRAAAPATRLAEALAAVHAVPQADFYPFDANTALATDLIPACVDWPDASPAPSPPGALPAVPTLILSGAQDLRTPTSLAAQVAAQISGAVLEVVPYTGHSVVGSDFSGCANAALAAFFSGRAVSPCATRNDAFSPTPVAPTSVSHLPAPPGLGGTPGRTLTAVLDTLVDLSRQVISATLQADQELPSGSSFGGLRGGYAELSASAARLRRYSFVAGVQLNGVFPVQNGELQPATIAISGSRAAHGTVTFGLRKYVSGALGGRRFTINLATVRLASSGRAAAREWPARTRAYPLPALLEAQPKRLP